jgi:hypothetical protein
MKLVIVAALVTLIALLGSRLTFLRIRLPLGIQNIFLTGSEYVLVGLLLGVGVLDILDAPTLRGLEPFLGLGLSWIGMLFGIQWEFRRILRIPARVFGIAACQSLVTAAVVGVAIYLVLSASGYETGPLLWLTVVAVAAAASDTGHSGLTLAARDTSPDNRPLARLLQNVSNIDGLLGLVAFGVATCFALPHPGSLGLVAYLGPMTYPGPVWVAVTVLLGGTVGLLVVALAAGRLRADQMRLVTLGAVAFSGGVALHLGLSPLLVNLVAGIVVANLARHRALAAIRTELLRGERAIYILFLVLVGAQWQWGGAVALGLAGVYLVGRILGKAGGGLVAASFFLPASLRGLGLGLLPQGGMAVAIVVNLHLLHPSPLSQAAISVVVVGLLVFEILSPAVVRRLLVRLP